MADSDRNPGAEELPSSYPPGCSLPKAPRYSDIADNARHRSVRCGPELQPISVTIQVVTPIFGGSADLRQIDDIDIIRVPTIRGHLRFWWRALHGHSTSRELFAAESRIWGAAAKDRTQRSSVELHIDTFAPTMELDP